MADDIHRIRIALELNALNAAGVFGESLEGVRIGTGTPIYDANPIHQDPIYERIPLTGGEQPAYADAAFDPAMGAVLMAVSHGLEWDARALLQEAESEAAKHIRPGSWDPAATRFVAYSYPKIAVQFSADGEELALLELWSWQLVPPRRDRPPAELPLYFDRWSYLDDQPAERLAAKREAFNARVRRIDAIPGRDNLALDRIARDQFAGLIDSVLDNRTSRAPNGNSGSTGAGTGTSGTGTSGTAGEATGAGRVEGELHFRTHGTSHATCYEVHPQETPVWCVAASVEMLLDFYRYGYDQPRIASELGLGSASNPNGLPHGQEDDVVDAIEAMTSNALDVTRLNNPSWQDFCDEIIANRPVISFVPGHARTVAGYVDMGSQTALGPFRGLLVYDPWPPVYGVVTRWENVAVQIYTIAFTAKLALV